MSNLKEIKDAARQAFSDQQLQDTEGGVPDAVSFVQGFLTGYRHRQDEIDKLSEGLDHYIEEASIYANASKKHFKEVQKLKREIETLDAHDEMLIATVKKMNLENEKLINALQFYAKNDNPDDEYNNGLALSVLKEIGEV